MQYPYWTFQNARWKDFNEKSKAIRFFDDLIFWVAQLCLHRFRILMVRVSSAKTASYFFILKFRLYSLSVFKIRFANCLILEKLLNLSLSFPYIFVTNFHDFWRLLYFQPVRNGTLRKILVTLNYVQIAKLGLQM